MISQTFSFTRLVALTAFLGLGAPLHAQDATAPATSLLSNGDFERDVNADGSPDDWGRMDNNRIWEREGDNRFLRLRATQPNTMLTLFRSASVPTEARALQLKWRQRISDLKVGREAWHDARIIINLKDAQNAALKPGPPAPYSRGNSAEWQTRSVSFLLPPGTKTIEVMPSLFNVQSGTFDLDDITLTTIDAAPLLAAQREREAQEKRNTVPVEAPQKAKWPPMLRVQGAQVLADGKKVWLQGANVVSLEFSVAGEHVMPSIRTAIEEWKANIIRPPVKADYWFGKAAKDNGTAYRERVDAAVNLAANRGAYLLLDLHQYRAPRKSDLAFWTSAATRYKNHPAVLFDLLNEPHGTSWEVWRDGGFVADKDASDADMAELSPAEKARNERGFRSVGMQAMLDAVRATGAKNTIVVGGLDWAYDLSGIAQGFGLKDSGGNGIIYSSHIYPWKRDWQNKVLVIADKHPILLGEVGADVKKFDFIPLTAQEDPATWVPDVLGLIQKYGLHWTGWSFHPATTPVMISDWNYTPTPFWGAWAKRALSGEKFTLTKLR